MENTKLNNIDPVLGKLFEMNAVQQGYIAAELFGNGSRENKHSVKLSEKLSGKRDFSDDELEDMRNVFEKFAEHILLEVKLSRSRDRRNKIIINSVLESKTISESDFNEIQKILKKN